MQLTSKLFITGIFVLSMLAVSISNGYAQDDATENSSTPKEVTRAGEKPNLLADKVKIDKELMAIDSILLKLELSEEENDENMLPADELYDGEWNNEYVKAYKNAVIPESYNINLADFTMPFNGKVTSKFGPRRRRYHYGTDIKLQKGDTVVAAFDGKIRVKKFQRRGYGYYLVIRHPNGLETVYGHLSKFLVTEGESVKSGQAIGLGGNTGRSYGSHLHFECRFLGQAINPEEIVDFENACTFDDSYAFSKTKSLNYTTNKYVAKGSGQIKYHRIKEGDSLSKIAVKYHTSVKELCRINGITKTYKLKIGKTIRYS